MRLRSSDRPWFPDIRETLLSYHLTLQKIGSLVPWDANHRPLSDLERLVIALEDRRFFSHPGVSLLSLCREILRFARGAKHGGASTIDMQLFRTVSGRYERTISRKLFEIVGAIMLQRRFSKLEILRSYLSAAYFGTLLNGAEQAAADHFSKLPNDLTLDESAELASFLVYPKPSIVSSNWIAKVRRRADYGLRILPRVEQRLR